MPETATPRAARLSPPGWRDSRLLVGVLLVLVSTVLGAWVVARADDRSPVYAAKGTVIPGQALTVADLVVVDARLGEGAAAYLPATGALPADAHALRSFRAGELIPLQAVGTAADIDSQPVALEVDATSAAVLAAGTVVDVWVNAVETGTTAGRPVYLGPEKLLDRVVVTVTPQEAGMLRTSSATTTVSVLVPVDQVGAMVAAVDGGAKVTLVPAPGQAAGPAS